jgi:hypothetical protein
VREITFKPPESIRVIAELASYIDSLKPDKEYVLTVKEKKAKRSLNANSYFWALCDQLAVKMGIGKTELYRQYIKEIGGNNEILCCQNEGVEKFCKTFSENGLGWITEKVDSKIKGCTNIIVYYGSSTYDTAQMSRLLNLIIQDCKEFGVPTLEDLEMQRLIDEWEKHNG